MFYLCALCPQGLRATANEGGGQQTGLAAASSTAGALLQTREFFPANYLRGASSGEFRARDGLRRGSRYTRGTENARGVPVSSYIPLALSGV